MPTLNWIGKEKVINHHQDVPFRVLEEQYSFGATDSAPDGNKIIHGDNLDALKALLPQYEGKVKLIYIDPPYNTGNQQWVYNDNVNDPKIKKWLGEVVGKEGEDLSRHDKWLCMMYPRLKLLHRLLADDGAIFISIDDNEQANLKLMCDEIFGINNFVSQVVVQTNPRGRTLDKYIAKTHEYIMVYKKSSISSCLYKIQKDEKSISEYKKEDSCGRYRLLELRNRNPIFNRANRPNLFYPFYGDPSTNTVSLIKTSEFCVEIFPINSKNEDGCWTWSSQKSQKEIDMLTCTQSNTGKWRVFRKDYLSGESLTTKSKALWTETTMNHENGKEIMGSLFGSTPFDFPKSVDLVKKCIQIGSHPNLNSIILDSFAGSGTTAHAVLNMNKQDGGNRKFILVEMEDYAETITAERVRRVIDGYGDGKNAVEGTGGGFTYYELGKPLLFADGNLNESVGEEKIRDYVWYMETKLSVPENKADEPYYLGETADTAYYFYYKKEEITTLGRDFLKTIKTRMEGYIIYADKCGLSPEELKQYGITFKKIPRDIAKL